MKQKLLIRIAIAVSICLFIGFLSAVATQSSINSWYTTLKKPFFTLPNWIFMPTWVLIYLLMGIAAGLIWNKGFYHKWVKTALYHFGFQLILNAAWALVFFGLRAIFPALLISIALFILLLFTFKWFKIVDNRAAYLLMPYILWIVFTTALNFEIWRLN